MGLLWLIISSELTVPLYCSGLHRNRIHAVFTAGAGFCVFETPPDLEKIFHAHLLMHLLYPQTGLFKYWLQEQWALIHSCNFTHQTHHRSCTTYRHSCLFWLTPWKEYFYKESLCVVLRSSVSNHLANSYVSFKILFLDMESMRVNAHSCKNMGSQIYLFICTKQLHWLYVFKPLER